MAKSYYTILGITAKASPKEVKAAYRRLAKEVHPDRRGGSSRPFLDIQEAYSVLGDSGKRREYDDHLLQSRRAESITSGRWQGVYEPEPLIPEDQPVDSVAISPIRSFEAIAPSLDELFDRLWENYSILSHMESEPISNLTLEVTFTCEEARQGGDVRVLVPARAVCPTCHGYGGIGPYECTRCAGEGGITGEIPVSIGFPAGLEEDHTVDISLDRYGIHNLYVKVVFRPSDQ